MNEDQEKIKHVIAVYSMINAAFSMIDALTNKQSKEAAITKELLDNLLDESLTFEAALFLVDQYIKDLKAIINKNATI